MTLYHCLIVEDEPLAQDLLALHLTAFPRFHLEGKCTDALQVLQIMNKIKIDLLFLDINLPLLSGIEFIRSIHKPPAVIFTTAYSEYAAESYELDTVDYLLKPITAEKFNRAIARFLQTREGIPGTTNSNYIFLKEGSRLVKVFVDEILFIEARKDYLMLYLRERNIMMLKTMKAMEDTLPPPHFVRIHRSYIVAKSAVMEIYGNGVKIGKQLLPMGGKYKKSALQTLNL